MKCEWARPTSAAPRPLLQALVTVLSIVWGKFDVDIARREAVWRELQGAMGARLARARGEQWFAPPGADDLWEPERCAKARGGQGAGGGSCCSERRTFPCWNPPAGPRALCWQCTLLRLPVGPLAGGGEVGLPQRRPLVWAPAPVCESCTGAQAGGRRQHSPTLPVPALSLRRRWLFDLAPEAQSWGDFCQAARLRYEEAASTFKAELRVGTAEREALYCIVLPCTAV